MASSYLFLCLATVMCDSLEKKKLGCCYDVVPYKPAQLGILPMFSEESRKFEFAGKTWQIKQQWEEIGVASVVWESAILLSQYLAGLDPSVLSGSRVIELGAGTGLVGMVASTLGASSVVLTDMDTRPAESNLNHNRHNILGKQVSVLELRWGSNVSTFDPPYDIILAADIVYIEDTYADLIKTLEDLSGPGSLLLLACKHRYEREDRFFRELVSSSSFNEDEIVMEWPGMETVKVHMLKRMA